MLISTDFSSILLNTWLNCYKISYSYFRHGTLHFHLYERFFGIFQCKKSVGSRDAAFLCLFVLVCWKTYISSGVTTLVLFALGHSISSSKDWERGFFAQVLVSISAFDFFASPRPPLPRPRPLCPPPLPPLWFPFKNLFSPPFRLTLWPPPPSSSVPPFSC